MNKRTVGLAMASLGLLCLLIHAIHYLVGYTLWGGATPPLPLVPIGIALVAIGAGLARQNASSV